jgi:hypothetical protein
VNEDSIMQAFALMDKELNPDGEGIPWLLVWDVCPNHISKALRAASLEKFPHIIKVYVKPRFTGESQPADLAFMAPVKAVIRRVASEELCEIIIDNIDEENPLADVVRRNVLKDKTALWFETAMKEVMNRPRLFDRAWRHLYVQEAEREQIEKEAEDLHEAGQLFETAGRNRIVPEDAPGPDEEELPVEILQQPEEAWDAFGIEEEAEDQEREDEFEEDVVGHPDEDAVVAGSSASTPPEEDVLVVAAPPPKKAPLVEATAMTRFAALRIIYGQKAPAS